MQYHRVYGGLHMLLNNIPLLKTGCHIEFSQMQEIWTHADATAKDIFGYHVEPGSTQNTSGGNGDYLRVPCILHK